jgi:hypothetical protein
MAEDPGQAAGGAPSDIGRSGIGSSDVGRSGIGSSDINEGHVGGLRVGDPEAAGDLLAEVRVWRRSARSARHAYWFPLVLFGLLTLAAMPFYVLPPTRPGISILATAPTPYMPLLGGSPGFLNGNYLGYYWLVALLGGLTLTLFWYQLHARRIGLATPARGYLTTGVVLTLLALVLPLLAEVRGFTEVNAFFLGDLSIRGTFPFLIIAVGLWVLAWAERSRGLAVVALVYTVTALLASLYDVENVLFRLGWSPSVGQWRLTSLPNVLLPALVLLVAGAAAFIVQRRQGRRLQQRGASA